MALIEEENTILWFISSTGIIYNYSFLDKKEYFSITLLNNFIDST